MRNLVFSMALLLPWLGACGSLGGGNRPDAPGILEVDFDDVPESPLAPRQPEIEAAEAEGALVEDPGLGLLAVVVESPESLAEVGLTAAAEEEQPFLDAVTTAVTAGLAEATYVLLFEPQPTEPTKPWLLGPDRLPLVEIARIDRTVPTCTTVVSTRAEVGEDEVGYGARIGALTEGICGGIAVLHSWIELKATTRANATNGANFKRRAVNAAQGRNKKKMTHRFLRQQHERVGATDCRTRPGAGVTTGSRQGLDLFARDLMALVEDPRTTWDCTLFVRTKGRNGDLLAHFEHIESVTKVGNNYQIKTTNGFNQGNGSTTVPASPGTNTWTASPGGNPAFKLTGTNATRPRNLVRGTPNVGIVNYLCCKKP